MYKPKLDDFDLELISSADTGIEKAIVEYEVPFSNGAILDDLGVKAHRYRLRTIWRRSNYERHINFIEHAAFDQVNTLVHPEFGRVRGRIKSVDVVHDRRRKCAEISFEFVEDKNPDAAPTHDPPLESALEECFNKAMAALIDTTAADLEAEGIDTNIEVDPDRSIAGQISARLVSARALLARLDQSMAALRGAINSVLNPLESAVGMLNYGASLPGAIVGTVARAAERAAMIAMSAGNAPRMFVMSLRSNLARLRASAPMLGNALLIAAASFGALITGRIFANDESKKGMIRRIEDSPQWKPDGTMLKLPPPPDVLTANELDESLALLRETIEDGIIVAREMGCIVAVAQLARQTDALTRYINVIKLERDRMFTVEIDDAMPLHLICLRHGLPYSYADRITTINDFWNPTFCAGEVRIYERRG